jgi:RNA polymerase sigma-70 factor (ECF subfamily)
MEDKVIVERVAKGDINAYGVLIERYQAYIFAIVAKHLPRDMVAETAHEAFVKAYEKLANYKGESAFRHWIARIALNLCADYWRKRQKNKEDSYDIYCEASQAWVEVVLDHASCERYEESVRRQEARELLDWALRKISPEDRLVLEMTGLDDTPVEEAAAILGWSVSKVKVRAHRARLKMRQELEKALLQGERDHAR